MTKTFQTIILLNLFSFTCFSEETNIISPEPLIHIIPIHDILNIDIPNDSIIGLNGIKKTGDYWTIAAYTGIYIMDKSLSKVKRSYRFDIKNNFELFDGQDSIVGFSSIKIIPNTAQTKFLVLTSNGILFQVDSKTLSVDWLIKFIDRIETATYSEQGDEIAIGTRYNYNLTSEQKKYYATLYLLDSKTGKFLKHLNESASILKICFAKSDRFLLVAYDWSSYDLWLWSITDNKPTLKFKSSNLHSGLEKINDTTFISTSTSQITLWQLSSKNGKTLFTNNGHLNFEKIIFNPNNNKYVALVTKPGPKGRQSYHLYFFNSDFLNPVFKNLDIGVEKNQFDFDKSQIYFASENLREIKKSGIFSYNMDNDEISLILDTTNITNDTVK